jgi:hypothetical protein
MLANARRAAWHRDRSDPSMFSFGASFNHDLTDFMAIRHDERARCFFERFNAMQDSQPLLCRILTAPDGTLFSSMALQDICAMVRVEGLDLTHHVHHLIGSRAKGDEREVRQFIRKIERATACIAMERNQTETRACGPVCKPWQPCISLGPEGT